MKHQEIVRKFRYAKRTARTILLAALLLAPAGSLPAQEKACPFNDSTLSFSGSPLEQARCLLRPVKMYARLGQPLAHLPAILEKLIGKPVTIRRAQLRKYLKRHGVREADIGGSLSAPVSRANDNDPNAPFARYFLIHDTSTPNYLLEPIPDNINQRSWKYNDLRPWRQGEQSKAHVFVNRLGESVTAVDFSNAWRATKFEIRVLGKRGKGLCLHIEQVQPRRSDPNGPPGNDAIAPVPGFTDPQLRRLALLYMAASLRRGSWMIPAYHAAIDAGIPGAHDDPQHFDLNRWAGFLKEILMEVNSYETGRP